jgi:uncharacterized protein (TIGR02246 family)
MQRINRAWLEKRPEELARLFHADITFVYPGFAGQLQGREAMVASFVDFCRNATVHDYREADHRADVIGETAVASFTYEMVYERSGKRNRATGRDLWIFARNGDDWIAVWRTMLDMAEQPA